MRLIGAKGCYAAVLALLVCLSGGAAMAEPPLAESTESTESTERVRRNNGQIFRAIEDIELDEAWSWLESRRDDVARNVTSTGQNIDAWLAGDVIGERSNASYLRIRLNQRVGRHKTYTSNARIGGRLDLPRASERWALIFESESEERSSLRDQRLSNIYPSSFTGGFRYELEERGEWKFSHDIGLRASLPLDPFYRFRTRYGIDLTDTWEMGARHRLFYYHEDGWGQDARLSFGRDITDSVYLRLSTDATYRHHRREVEFSQYVALYQELGELETMSYEVGLLGINRPNTQIENYYAQMVYRNAIYEDWLIMEVVPQLLVEKEKSWKPDPRVQLTLEVYFFDF